MFVLTETGDVYVFKIKEHYPTVNDMDHFSKNTAIVKGELLIDEPIHVKDLKDIKMIASGSDHCVCLTKQGDVYAMGDDTFG